MAVRQFSDERLIEAFNQGNPAAFKQVFDTHYSYLYYFTRKLILNEEEAEEITLDTFKKLFDRYANFDTNANIKAFLFITARNNCLNYLRAEKVIKKKQKKFADQMQNNTLLQYEFEIKDDLIKLIRAAVDKLPTECGKVFKMLYFEDLTRQEVAEILNIAPKTVDNHRALALKALRMSLGDHSLAIFWLLIVFTHQQESLTGWQN